MTKEALAKKKLPDASGVYFFLGARKEILYIGKATSLKNRVRSYFATDVAEKRSELIEKMVAEAKSIDWTVTDSVLEALILETNLIRTHKPRYNTISKDDKSYNHLIITNEEWPRVLVVRGKDLTEQYNERDIKYHFGPFTSGTLFREALKIVRRLFKFYDTKDPVGSQKSKLSRGTIDFNRQIGLYPDEASKQKYATTIRHIRLFFEGKKATVIKELEKEMLTHAKHERFEDAEVCKRRIFALEHIQDIALIKNELKLYRDEKRARIEAYDIAHMAGADMVGVMTVLEGGEVIKSDYRKFKIQTVTASNDTAALREVLERRLGHPEWPLPQLMVVDGSTAQKNVAEKVLKAHHMLIPVVAVTKDEHHKPKAIKGSSRLVKQFQNEILLANAEAHRFAIGYHTKKRSQTFLPTSRLG
ncbi:GIY-YIG nuclease family protein [Candidatus Nomurabacteria bacterium]|nr:GIY-YIG nuclease family protein [Candidatus Nomurabacteria bacterium]